MRITCTATKRGNIFRFYKDDDNFHRDLKPLVPLILACSGEVLVNEEDDLDVVDDNGGALLLTAGPLTSDAEAELVRRAQRHFAPACASPPAP